jgi:hypothetical protein
MTCRIFVVKEKAAEGGARSGFLLGEQRNVKLPFGPLFLLTAIMSSRKGKDDGCSFGREYGKKTAGVQMHPCLAG